MASLILYFSVFGISSFSASFFKDKIKPKLLYYIAVISLPVALAGLRYGIGTDYFSYFEYYKENLGGQVKTHMEPLFRLLNLICARVGGGYVSVLMLSSFITHLFVLSGLARVLKGRYLSLGMFIFYCFYYSASLNTVRQLIALSIVFYGAVMLFEDRYAAFVLLASTASLFHVSALVSLLLLPLKIGSLREDLTRIFTVIIATLTGVFGIFGRKLFEILPYFIRSRYEKYLRPDGGGIVTLEYLFDILPIFLIIAVPIFIYILLGRKNGKYDFFCLAGLSCLPVLILGYNFAYFQRLVYYFDISQLICAPIACCGVKVKGIRNFLFVTCIILYFLYFLYSSYYHGSNEIFPYRWILRRAYEN